MDRALKSVSQGWVYGVAVVSWGILSGCGGSSGSGDGAVPPIQVEAPPTSQKYIVKFRDSLLANLAGEQSNLVQSLAGDQNRVEAIRENLYTVELAPEADAFEVVRSLQSSNEVEFVEPDANAFSLHQPNDPSYGQQWAHKVIQSSQAWDITQGSHQVVVAVIDTGVDYTHPDLVANMWKNPGEIAGNNRDDDGNGLVDDVYGYDFANKDGDPMADDTSNGKPVYHGTHCAGSVGAVGDNNLGIIGHSPRVKIMALKFLKANGNGDVSDAIRAIDYAIAQKAKIMSNSWGSSQSSQALAQAVERAKRAGILFIAAAGNGGHDGIGDNNDRYANYPSNIAQDNVIAVAASNSSDQLTGFSNYGAKTVHLAAPGENILSTQNGGKYQNMSGTSMATPLVSGVAALLIALRPDLSYLDIKNALMNTVDQLPAYQGKTISNGRINAYKAVASIQNGKPVPTPTPTPVPSPSPTPKPTPSPTQPPLGGIARSPLLNGQTQLQLGNPGVAVAIDYDVTEFPGAAGVYVEVSRPNQSFSNPNGTSADPGRLLWLLNGGSIGRAVLVPSMALPGWGVYQIRVIPLDHGQRALGRFSSGSALVLRPGGGYY